MPLSAFLLHRVTKAPTALPGLLPPPPQAAQVFLEAARTCTLYKPTNLVSIGEATGELLKKAGASIVFTPSKALAKVLVVELPEVHEERGGMRRRKTAKVLYPASKRAARTLEEGLQKRGLWEEVVEEEGEGMGGEKQSGRLFDVIRLNTYDTVPADWTDEEMSLAQSCAVVTFASPSALKVWAARLGMDFNMACIGETTATAAIALGWDESRIFYPKDAPGIDGWASAVMDALEAKDEEVAG